MLVLLHMHPHHTEVHLIKPLHEKLVFKLPAIICVIQGTSQMGSTNNLSLSIDCCSYFSELKSHGLEVEGWDLALYYTVSKDVSVFELQVMEKTSVYNFTSVLFSALCPRFPLHYATHIIINTDLIITQHKCLLPCMAHYQAAKMQN